MYVTVTPTNRRVSASGGNPAYGVVSQQWDDYAGPVTFTLSPYYIFVGPATIMCASSEDATFSFTNPVGSYGVASQFTMTWPITADDAMAIPIEIPFGPWYVSYTYSGSDNVTGTLACAVRPANAY